MKHNIIKQLTALLLTLGAFIFSFHAQGATWQITGTGDWNNSDNWDWSDGDGFYSVTNGGTAVLSSGTISSGEYPVYSADLSSGAMIITGNSELNYYYGMVGAGTEMIISGNGYVKNGAFGYIEGTLTIMDSGSFASTAYYGYSITASATLNMVLSTTGAKINLGSHSLDGALVLGPGGANSASAVNALAADTYTIIHASGALNGSFAAVQAPVDYITASATKSPDNRDYNATFSLSWLADDSVAHGTFTTVDNAIFGIADTFDQDVPLADRAGITSGWDGQSLTKEGGGTLILSAVNTYTGSTTVNSGTLIFNQSGNQTLQGLVSGSGVLVQQGSGTLALTQSGSYGGTVINNSNFSLGGVDQQINNLVNNGNVYFVNLGKTLTLTNLGGNGDFHMDVNITTGESDKIVVTGTLSGVHRLNITNIGGDSGNDFDITLATAANHDGGTFISDFDIGMFTYELQGTGTRYYITRATDPAPPTPPAPPQAGPTGEDLLADLPSQSQAWFDNMNNISNHLGDLRVNASVNASGARERRPLGGGILDAVWIKSYGQQVNVSGRVVGAAFREYQYGVDAGTDHRWTLDKNNTLILGGFVGYGSLDRTLRNGLQNDGSTDNYHFGLYGIWLHDSGLYADFIAKGQYADHEVNAWDASNNHTTADYNNWGGGVTLDLGKKFEFKDGWYAEPSLSVGYAHFTGESYTANSPSPFTVTTTDADVFQFKLGIQFGRTITLSNGGILQPYIKVSGVEQLSTGGKLKASGAEWRPTLDGASAEVGGGVIWQLNTQHSLTLDYEASFGGKYDKPWGLTAGYRYQF